MIEFRTTRTRPRLDHLNYRIGIWSVLGAWSMVVCLPGCQRKNDTSADAPAKPVVVEAKAPEAAELFADWPKPAVALVITGQQLGYIEPCGCTGLENQKGGLARRQTFIKRLIEDRGWPVVAFDVGSQVKGFGKQQEVKFSHAVQGLRAMGYKAVTLGEGDLKLTPGEVLAAIAGPDGTVNDFVSANVAVLARDLQPQSVIVEAGGK